MGFKSRSLFIGGQTLCARRILLCVLALISWVSGLIFPIQTFAADTNPESPPPVTIEEGRGRYLLGQYLETLEDPSGKLRLEDFLQPERAPQFRRNPSANLNLGFSRSAWWIRFRVRNETDRPQSLRLELGWPNVPYVTFYSQMTAGSAFDSRATGRALPFETRALSHQNFVFPLELNPGAEQIYYLRCSGNGPLFLPLKLWSENAYERAARTGLLVLGLAYGALLIMIFCNGGIAIGLRESSFVYFSLFLVAYTMDRACSDGVDRFFLPDAIGLSAVPALLSMAAMIVLGLRFTSVFLETRSRAPGLHRFSLILKVVAALTLIPTFANQERLAFAVLYLLTVLGCGFILLSSAKVLSQGFRPARLFLAAWSVLSVVMAANALAGLGLIPAGTLLVTHLPRVAGLLAVLLWSLALTERYRQVKGAHERDQAEQLRLNQEMLRQSSEFASALQTSNAELTRSIEERKRSEAALLESEARLKMLGDASFEGVGVCQDGILVDANDQLVQMLGYPRTELIGKLVMDLIAPESRDFVRKVTESGRVEPYEHLAIRKDGTIFPVEVCARTIATSDRHLRITVARDISARKEAENRLRTLNERLKVATQTAAMAVWDWDLGATHLVCNDRMFELYQLPRDPNGILRYEDWACRVHPEDLPAIEEYIQRRITDQGHGGREFRIVLPDESIRYIQAADAILTNEQGKPIRMIGVNLDITERRQDEESLRESEKRFRSYFELPIVGLTMTSPEKGFLAVNDQFCATLGYSREELLQKRWPELTHPDDLTLDTFQFKSVLAGELDGYSLEKRFVRKDGGIVHALVSVRCVRREDGAVDYLIGLLQDITDRKRAEAEQAESMRREQQALENYTHRLIESQEAERRRIAGELHDSLGQNLLLIKNRIQQALTASALHENSRAHLEAANELSSQAIAEVRNISHDLRPYQIDQLGLTRALEVMIDGAAESTGVVFERKLEQVDELFESAAATNLYRIVQECLANILRHADARHVRIKLERDIHFVRLWIRDDGCGFSSKPANELPSGGLGLRNISERVRILKGSLNIYSAPGEGTSFLVTIPAGS